MMCSRRMDVVVVVVVVVLLSTTISLTLAQSSTSILADSSSTPPPVFNTNLIEFHGSGTSNPSRCIWHVLETMEVQTKVPTHLTYRSTSTGPGQLELMGNITHPYNDFASGDVPLSKQDYEMMKLFGQDIVHLPILMGAIGIFHSVPVERGYDLNLTSCTVAKIFQRQITDWTHPDITAINPNMRIPKRESYSNVDDGTSFPITVARRLLSSSSTAIFTEYLHATCPSVWDASLVGGTIEWHADTEICEGSSAMGNCIQSEAGMIGYVDSGYGHAQGLEEVALENKLNLKDGKESFYLTSKTSFEQGGILSALSSNDAGIPSEADDDWSTVNIINKENENIYTWPMVSLSYLYVRKDLSYLQDPRAQSLLIAFLQNMYNENYVRKCQDEFGFVLVTGSLMESALKGIQSLQVSSSSPNDTTPTWIVEDTVLLDGATGQGDYVISNYRKRSFLVEQDLLMERVHDMETTVNEQNDALDTLVQQTRQLENVTTQQLEDYGTTIDNLLYGYDEKQELHVAYILAILSFTLWSLTAMYVAVTLKSQRSILQEIAKVNPNHTNTNTNSHDNNSDNDNDNNHETLPEESPMD